MAHSTTGDIRPHRAETGYPRAGSHAHQHSLGLIIQRMGGKEMGCFDGPRMAHQQGIAALARGFLAGARAWCVEPGQGAMKNAEILQKSATNFASAAASGRNRWSTVAAAIGADRRVRRRRAPAAPSNRDRRIQRAECLGIHHSREHCGRGRGLPPESGEAGLTDRFRDRLLALRACLFPFNRCLDGLRCVRVLSCDGVKSSTSFCVCSQPAQRNSQFQHRLGARAVFECLLVTVRNCSAASRYRVRRR